MSAWVLVVVFIHQEGIHSMQVPFVTGKACEAAAQQWRTDDRQWSRMRQVFARCHLTDVR